MFEITSEVHLCHHGKNNNTMYVYVLFFFSVLITSLALLGITIPSLMYSSESLFKVFFSISHKEIPYETE